MSLFLTAFCSCPEVYLSVLIWPFCLSPDYCSHGYLSPSIYSACVLMISLNVSLVDNTGVLLFSPVWPISAFQARCVPYLYLIWLHLLAFCVMVGFKSAILLFVFYLFLFLSFPVFFLDWGKRYYFRDSPFYFHCWHNLLMSVYFIISDYSRNHKVYF